MASFAGIKIRGKCFSSETTLMLFPDNARFARLYGRNGAGKSTISSILSDVCQGLCKPNTSLSLIDESGVCCSDEESILASTYIFNEDFVDKNVKIKNTGLEAIVLLGDAGEYADQIEQCKADLAQLATQLESLQLQESAFASSEGEQSIPKAKSDLLEALKGDAHWAGRDRKIKGSTRNTSINDHRMEAIRATPLPEKSLIELSADFDRKLEDYLRLKDDSAHPLTAIELQDDLFVNRESLEKIQKLLAKEIDSPQLSEREMRILEIAEKYGNGFVENAVRQLSTDNLGYCPYCFRDISDNYIEDIEKIVSEAFGQKVEEHQMELQNARLSEVVLDTAEYESMFPDLCRELSGTLENYNSEIRKTNALLERKGQNAYSPISFEMERTEETKEQSIEAIDVLRKAINEYNSELGKISAKLSELESLNNQLARLEIEPFAKKLSELTKEQESIKADIVAAGSEMDTKKVELAVLEAKKSNIHVALDLINKGLSFIFMDSSHIQLDGSSGEYRILSNSTPVPPSAVSSGERNAIGLCYFFSCIGKGHAEQDRFASSMFLLIDDPISSFDYENKIGIITFLRRQIGRALSDNDGTRIAVMTHDYQTMLNLGKIYEKDIRPAYRERNLTSGRTLPKEKSYELRAQRLLPWDKTLHDYSSMLNELYAYATAPSADLRPYIGNVARKVLESFSTFEYQKGLDAYSTSPDILAHIEDDAVREYFEGYMSRLLLHEESHAEDAIHGESALVTFNHYSEIELARVVRDAVVLLYCLNDEHVLSHLSCADAKTEIEEWVQEIRASQGYRSAAQTVAEE